MRIPKIKTPTVEDPGHLPDIDGIVKIEGQEYAYQIKADPSFGIRWRQLGRNRKVESRVKFFNSVKARDRFVDRLFGNPTFLLIDSQFEGDR